MVEKDMKGGISHAIRGYVKTNDKNKESSYLRSLCLIFFPPKKSQSFKNCEKCI